MHGCRFLDNFSSASMHKVVEDRTGAEPSAFAELVGGLERASGRRLRGGWRIRCLHAWRQSPTGFERLVGEAGRRARINALGLLCAMVREDEHLLSPADGLEEVADRIEWPEEQ